MKLEELRSKLAESKPHEPEEPQIPLTLQSEHPVQGMYRCPCCGRGLLAAPEPGQGSAATLCCNKMVFWDADLRRWAH
jgi:hypothetical protein